MLGGAPGQNIQGLGKFYGVSKMRLIGMALLAFLLAATALFLSNSETLRLGVRAISEVALGPQLTFETTAKPHAAHKRSAMVHRLDPSEPIILTGLPAYQSATFAMPVDARPASGYLQIDTTTQVLSGVEGVLRVSIDNSKRAELLLRPGEGRRSLRIELTEHDIAREKLVVSFSLQGDGPQLPCGVDKSLEAIVEIETTSAIFLELEKPLESNRDKALVAGNQIRVVWSDNIKDGALLAARRLLLAGASASFDPDGIAKDEADALADLLVKTRARPVLAWSDVLSPNSSIFGTRYFRHQHKWRVQYDMSRAQDRRLPGTLDLSMQFSRQLGGAYWQVSVTLNGHLVDQSLHEDTKLRRLVELPTKHQQRINVIEVTASSTFDAPGECNRGPELFAEVQAQTSLVPSSDVFTDRLLSLLDKLKTGWTVSATDLTQAEARKAAELLALLPDSEATSANNVKISALNRGASLDAWRGLETEAWLVSFDEDQRARAQTISEYASSEAREVVLVVDFAGVGS